MLYRDLRLSDSVNHSVNCTIRIASVSIRCRQRDGCALKKVPILEHVLSASIVAWQVKEYGLGVGLPDEDAWPSGK